MRGCAAPPTQRANGAQLVASLYRIVGKRADQQAAQVAAIELRPVEAGLPGRSSKIVPALSTIRLASSPRPDDTTKRVEQPGIGQRALPALLVDVQQPALPARLWRGLALVDDGGDAVPAQDASQRKAAKPGADDGDGFVHSVGFCSSGRHVWAPAASVVCSRWQGAGPCMRVTASRVDMPSFFATPGPISCATTRQ